MQKTTRPIAIFTVVRICLFAAGMCSQSLAAPSGENMPVGDIAGWHQIFTDDFLVDVATGAFPDAVATKWSAYLDGWNDTSRNGTYFPSKVVSIHDGVMDLYIHTENSVHLVSAPVPKLPGAVGSGGGLLYGRYVAWFKSDAIPNYKTAWLLWPDSEVWPRDGEIDFPEGDLDGTISAFMHRQNGTSGGDQDAFSTLTTFTSWHTAIIEWTATRINFILDGTIVGSSTQRIPNTPMHWVLQIETALGTQAPANDATGHVLIDWVAVYVPASTNTANARTTVNQNAIDIKQSNKNVTIIPPAGSKTALSISIYDLNGRQVRFLSARKGEKIIGNVSACTPGVYQVVCATNGTNLSKKSSSVKITQCYSPEFPLVITV